MRSIYRYSSQVQTDWAELEVNRTVRVRETNKPNTYLALSRSGTAAYPFRGTTNHCNITATHSTHFHEQITGHRSPRWVYASRMRPGCRLGSLFLWPVRRKREWDGATWATHRARRTEERSSPPANGRGAALPDRALHTPALMLLLGPARVLLAAALLCLSTTRLIDPLI